MLGTLLIWLSVAVAILAIVDLFLSDSQKTWLSNAVIKTWNVLDEAKGWSFADWLKEPRAAWWLAMALSVASWVGVFGDWKLDSCCGEGRTTGAGGRLLDFDDGRLLDLDDGCFSSNDCTELLYFCVFNATYLCMAFETRFAAQARKNYRYYVFGPWDNLWIACSDVVSI